MPWGVARLQNPPLTTSQQLALISEWIDVKFCQPRGGKTEQMESMQHLWEYIISSGDQPTVCVCCTAEKQRSFNSLQESDRTHRVDRRWTVAIIRGRGFRTLMQDPLGTPPNGKEMLTDSIDALRDAVRALVNVSEEFPVHYDGWDSLPPVARPGTANVFVAGALLEFSTANDLGEVSQTATS